MDQVDEKVYVASFVDEIGDAWRNNMLYGSKVFTNGPSTQTAMPKPTPKWKMFLYQCQYWLEKKTEPVRNKLIKALGGYTEDEAYGDYL